MQYFEELGNKMISTVDNVSGGVSGSVSELSYKMKNQKEIAQHQATMNQIFFEIGEAYYHAELQGVAFNCDDRLSYLQQLLQRIQVLEQANNNMAMMKNMRRSMNRSSAYPNQPYQSQPYPNQPYQSQPYPNQPHQSQPHPNQILPNPPVENTANASTTEYSNKQQS